MATAISKQKPLIVMGGRRAPALRKTAHGNERHLRPRLSVNLGDAGERLWRAQVRRAPAVREGLKCEPYWAGHALDAGRDPPKKVRAVAAQPKRSG